MQGINKVIVVGHLGKDPEITTAGTFKVANCSIATVSATTMFLIIITAAQKLRLIIMVARTLNILMTKYHFNFN
jgi:hypothetical protein